ncbi:MAG: hypothetical protein L0271_21715 [Gemmatimonadetes bacterium]|nr:hypothetical protein [Gemmatimonadota bacterium]
MLLSKEFGGSSVCGRHAPRVLLAVVLIAGCSEPPESTATAGAPVPGLTADQLARFTQGEVLLHHEFTPEEGLGPLFNQRRCSSCHDLPTLGGMGEEPIVRATSFAPPSTCDLLTDVGGENIQQRSTPLLEAALGVFGEEVPRDRNASVALIVPPSLYGLGLVEAIAEADLLANEDPGDENGDGISGRAGRTAAGATGRFGRKGEFATLRGFIAGAALAELGLTTTAHPVEETRNGIPVPPGTDPVAEPELSDEQLSLLVDYVRFLAAPEREAPQAARDTIAHGERVFNRLGCALCHIPSMRTAADAPAPLGNRTIRLYSDLLLHDMGEAMASTCGIGALPGEWRTAPLMGLRLRHKFLYDGRAGGIGIAIEAHDGEARGSRNGYFLVDEADRQALIRFLLSL